MTHCGKINVGHSLSWAACNPYNLNVQNLCQWDKVHSSVGQLLRFDQYCASTQIQVLKSAVLDSGINDLT
jgi:hypothetical protein